MNDQVYVIKYGKNWQEEKRKWELIKKTEDITFYFSVIALAFAGFTILNNTILNIFSPFSLASLCGGLTLSAALLWASILINGNYKKEELWKVENLVKLRDLGQLKFKDKDWKDYALIFEKDETWAINKKTKKAKVVNFNGENKD